MDWMHSAQIWTRNLLNAKQKCRMLLILCSDHIVILHKILIKLHNFRKVFAVFFCLVKDVINWISKNYLCIYHLIWRGICILYRVRFLSAMPVAVRSKASVCSTWVTGIGGSNPAEGMDVRLLCFLCVVGSSLCDELLTRPQDSYRLCMSNYMWSRGLNNEAAYAHFGLLCHRRKNSRQDEIFWEI